MSRRKQKDLDLIFKLYHPIGFSTYDIIQEAWERQQNSINDLEDKYLILSERIERLDYELTRNAGRFRSVINAGIISTSIFGSVTVFLLKIGYLTFEVGFPLLIGLSSILIGFLNGWRKNK